MKRNIPEPSKKNQQQPEVPPSDRRSADRRKAKSDGYTYIPMVGWYCRREESRRNEDETLK